MLLGCSIILEKKAKEYILTNLKNTLGFNRNQLILKIRNFKNQTGLPLTLKNFTGFYHIALPLIYKHPCWNRLCVDAEVRFDYPNTHEKAITRSINLKWLAGNSYSYYKFILSLCDQQNDIDIFSLTAEERIMCLMLHYDVWQDASDF